MHGATHIFWSFYFWEITFKHQLVVRSVQFSCSVVSDSLRPHESQHARPPYPSPTPGVHSDSCPSSQWCHPAISSSVVLFSSCPQSLPASESFPMSQLFAWGAQSTGVSALASFLPKKSQGWSPSEWTGWICCSPSRTYWNIYMPVCFEFLQRKCNHQYFHTFHNIRTVFASVCHLELGFHRMWSFH